jgi:hypothetical protein
LRRRASNGGVKRAPQSKSSASSASPASTASRAASAAAASDPAPVRKVPRRRKATVSKTKITTTLGPKRKPAVKRAASTAGKANPAASRRAEAL